MSCVAFFGIGIVIQCGCECFRQQPRIPRYRPVLSVAERAAIGMMKFRAGKRLEMVAFAQDRIEAFVFLFDKNHILDLFRSLPSADRYDTVLARLDLYDVVVIDSGFDRLDLVESTFCTVPKTRFESSKDSTPVAEGGSAWVVAGLMSSPMPFALTL